MELQIVALMGGHSSWLQVIIIVRIILIILAMKGLSSPLIAEDEGAGGKELKLRFDVSQYTPEEIMVKTVDNKLLVLMMTMMIMM